MKHRIAFRKRALVIVQKTVRGYLVKKQHGPRIKALRNIRALSGNLQKIEASASQLKKDKDSTTKQINQLKEQFSVATNRIKVRSTLLYYIFYRNHSISLQSDDKIDPKAAEALYTDLVAKVNQQMAALQKKLQEQKNAEEQERLRKIQEELERQKKLKEEEERKQREEEENRRKKAEIEARRKIEEEERKKQVTFDVYRIF